MRGFLGIILGGLLGIAAAIGLTAVSGVGDVGASLIGGACSLAGITLGGIVGIMLQTRADLR